jgi:short-chain fatty acids transporter
LIHSALHAVDRLGYRCARIARAIVPDPWIIAIALAVLVLVAGTTLERKTPLELTTIFAFGFFDTGLLAFGFQMILVLMTGTAIATAPIVERAMRRLAGAPSTSGGAAAVTALVAMVLALFNWGLGLVAGALLTREMARSFMLRGIPLNRGVVGAAGFLGIAVWHGGLSGSAPLKVAVDGAYGPAIPVTETLFSTANLVVTPVLVTALALLMYALGRVPSTADGQELPSAPETRAPKHSFHHLDRIENSMLLVILVAVPLAVALVRAVVVKGAPAINLDWVILVFLVAGLLLHKSPLAYANAFAEGAKEAAGIVLQFPLYFGIIAVARDSGVVEVIAHGFASLAQRSADLLQPSTAAQLFTYLSACVVNFFVPSGGAQWVVQSPLMLEMATSAGVDRATLVMPFAWGDQTTNLLQPFWALPLLSISGLKAKDVMGYTMLAMIVQMTIILAAIVVFS